MLESDSGAGVAPRPTGVAVYDRTRFSGRGPTVSHVVPNYFGAGLLLQHGRGVAPGLRIESPPAPLLRVLVRRRRAPRVDARIDGVAYRGAQEPGAFVVIPAGAASHWISDAETLDQTAQVHLDAGLLDEIAVEETDRPFPRLAPRFAPPDARVAAAAEALLAEAARPGGPSAAGWRAALTLLALRLATGQTAPAPPARGGLAAWQIRRVRDLMTADLSRDVSLAELAAVARLSPFHFCRAFHRSVGEPPRAHLTRLRLAEAKRLLRRTELTVGEIAASVGYESAQSLARLFRRTLGVGPLAYRAAVRA